jgi:hypothetical protein
MIYGVSVVPVPFGVEHVLRIVSSSCSISSICCVTLVTNLVISHECGKDRIVIITNRTYGGQL